MRSRKQWIGLAALLALATAVPALAQPNSSSSATTDYPLCTRQVTDQDSEAAHAAYLAGKGFYDTSKWEAAIVKFREAYARDCTKHELLVILSRAYEFNHDLPNAIKALQTYIARVPNAPDKKTYDDRIKSLEQQYADAKKAQASATPSASAPPPPVASSSAPAQPPPPQGEVREHTIWPWLVTIVGGGGIVTGVILLAIAPSLPENCKNSTNTCTKITGETDAELQTEQDKAGQHVNDITAGVIFTAVGVGVVAGGLIWHFVEPTGPTTGKPRILPVVTPGYAGASVGASF